MNTFGNIFRFTDFGESHGAAVGGVVDGMPAGVKVDLEFLAAQMARRRPGQSAITTQRQEPDTVEILSGVFEGVTTSAPIGFVIRNVNQRSTDYEHLREAFRPNHADFTYTQKYGLRDHRGGGRSSARETAARVAAGALAQMALRELGITVTAYTSQIGPIRIEEPYTALDLEEAERNPVRAPHAERAAEMERLLMEVRGEGDTIGGVVTCVVRGVPVGVGEPVAGRLASQLASAMLSINAAKGFDYGSGFEGLERRGSELMDKFVPGAVDGSVTTASNHSGGIQGGISNGQDIYFRVAFKPIATLLQEVETVDSEGRPTVIKGRGRHDPCAVPRAVPVVEAMAAMVILDNILLNRASRL